MQCIHNLCTTFIISASDKLQGYDHGILKEVKKSGTEPAIRIFNMMSSKKVFNLLPNLKRVPITNISSFLHSRTAINDKLYKMNLTDSILCKLWQTEYKLLDTYF